MWFKLIDFGITFRKVGKHVENFLKSRRLVIEVGAEIIKSIYKKLIKFVFVNKSIIWVLPEQLRFFYFGYF